MPHTLFKRLQKIGAVTLYPKRILSFPAFVYGRESDKLLIVVQRRQGNFACRRLNTPNCCILVTSRDVLCLLSSLQQRTKCAPCVLSVRVEIQASSLHLLQPLLTMAVLTVPVMCNSPVCRRPRSRARTVSAFVDSTSTENVEYGEQYVLPHADMVVPKGTRWTSNDFRVASTPLRVLQERLDAEDAAAAAAEHDAEIAKANRVGPFSNADGARGTIPLQDKFGLLLSICSLLVSVQIFMPRVL